MKIKKIVFFLLVLFLTSFAFSKDIHSQETFYKNTANPLQFTGSLDNWPEIGRFQPTIYYDGAFFHMWYSSLTNNDIQIAYAISNDGLLWDRKKIFKLIDGSINHDPSLLIAGNKMSLFFASSNTTDGFRINKIDLINPSTPEVSSIKTVLSPTDPWESIAVSSPFIYHENGTYYLFYSGASDGWNIGLATSTDGNIWTRCLNNPIIRGADGPSILKLNNKYIMYVHRVDGGINQWESNDELSCISKWDNVQQIIYKGPFDYDQAHVTSPTSLLNNQNIYLYYSGLSNNGNWTINLATSTNIVPQLTPTPTQIEIPSPTLTPTITLSPTPNFKKDILVIIPGMLASWNYEAMIHNKEVSLYDWYIPSYVHEYSGIEKSLLNIGYIKNKDFYIFPYDWRQNIETSADQLALFIHEKIENNPNIKIKLLGHSLGGLIARIYAHKNPERVSKLVTVGSPHYGVAQAYKLVEGGEFNKEDSLLWLAQKIVLFLNKNKFETDKETIESKMPVAVDLLPTFNFLIDENNNNLDYSKLKKINKNMKYWNTRLIDIYGVTQAIAGKKGNTPSGYKIHQRNFFDKVLNLYPDGRPIANLFEEGDETVLLKSASISSSSDILNADHRDLIVTKDNIKKIFDLLGITIDENSIVEGTKTNLKNALIFMIKSPASFVVTNSGKIYTEENGLVFISNAESGTYYIEVNGKEKGHYNLIIGELTEKKDRWQNIEGLIKTDSPKKQIDKYILEYSKSDVNNTTIKNVDVSNMFDLLIEKLNEIKPRNKHFMSIIYQKLDLAKKAYKKKNLTETQRQLLNTQNELFNEYLKMDKTNKIKIAEINDQLENLYTNISINNNSSVRSLELKIKLFTFLIEYYKTKTTLKYYKNSKEIILLIKWAEDLKNEAKFYINKDKNRTQILLNTVQNLSRVISFYLK